MKKTIPALLIVFLMTLSIVSAFTILSSDKVDFVSNEPKFNAPAFLVLAIENGGAQQVYFDPQQLKSSDGKTSEKKASIKSEITDYKIQYPLINDGKELYNVQVLSTAYYIPFIHDEAWGITWCNGLSKGGAAHFIAKDSGTLKMLCLEFDVVGYLGRIEQGQILYQDKITVTVDGVPKEVILSNANAIDTEGNYVIAEFQANGGSNNLVPVPGKDFDAIWQSSDNKYIIADKKLTAAYWGKIRKNVRTKDDFLAICNYLQFGDLDKCVAEINSLAKIPESQYTTYQSNIVGSKEAGSLTLSNTPMYTYPIFTLRINAEWVGIYTPVGKPKVTPISGEKFMEGKSGNIVIKVKNEANVDAAFNIGITCPSFLPLNAEKIPFKANEEKELTYYITAETESKSCETCKIVVKDSTNPLAQATTNQEICVTEAVQCSPVGKQTCNGKLIQECKVVNGVQVWNTLTTCDQECKINVDTQVPECIKGFECPEGLVKCPDGTCLKEGECGGKCTFSLLHPIKYLNCLLDQIKIYLALGVGLIVALISFLMLFNMFGKDKKGKGNSVGVIISILIALILGAIVGTILYVFINAALYILIGLIVIGIIAGIIYMFIPKIPGRR